MVTSESLQTVNIISGAIEAPRYSCALGGAYSTAVGIFGVVPILHSGAGCGIGQLFGQFYGGGQNAGGPYGGTSTPCSSLVEEHVIFGGEKKLASLIESTAELVDGDLLAVISGCVPSLIGDDVGSVVRAFKEKNPDIPIIHVNTSGFAGTSYDGYEHFFNAVIDQFLEKTPKEKGLVNVFGIVPSQHIFWKGEAREIKTLLERIGLKPNLIIQYFTNWIRKSSIPITISNI